MKNNIFSVSNIGIVSMYGIRIGMSPEEVCEILDNFGLKYESKRFNDEPLSDIEITVSNYKIADGIPLCDLYFRFRYGTNLSFIKVGAFYLELEQAKILYQFLKEEAESMGLNVQKWDNLDKENETLCYVYNWAQSIEIHLKEKSFNNKHQNPVSLIIRPHEGQKIIPEIINISNFLGNSHKNTGRHNKRDSILLYIIIAITVFILGMLIFLFFSNPNSSQHVDGFYSIEAAEDNSPKTSGVYVCTSQNAKKYHRLPDCRWLENCSGEIKEVTLTIAENQGKTPCKSCFK